jgi:hypothetical protein
MAFKMKGFSAFTRVEDPPEKSYEIKEEDQGKQTGSRINKSLTEYMKPGGKYDQMKGDGWTWNGKDWEKDGQTTSGDEFRAAINSEEDDNDTDQYWKTPSDY